MRPLIRTVRLVAVALALGTAGSCTAAPAWAAEPRKSGAAAPEGIDVRDPDLRLSPGKTLAEPRVLPVRVKVRDIRQVVEDEKSAERREDTNAEVRFALPAAVLFGEDSSRLSGGAQARIAAIAREIKDQKATTVHVFGFTDDQGSAAHGDVLSKQRADAVRDVLDDELPGSSITFDVRGFGERHPAQSNASEEGRARNRRVEVSFPHQGA
jgi:outer membrane protein OmpA-like peptidoglycan-associated protein